MPGRLFLITSAEDVSKAFGVQVAVDLSQRFNIAPGQDVLTLTAHGFSMMRWGIIPVGRVNARGRPVMETIINAQSETVFDKSAFAGVRRAVIPASGWYEWAGEKRRKTPWRIAPKTGELLAFAAIFDVWKGPGGVEVSQVASVTCEPNLDVKPVHHRMGGLLDLKDVQTWLLGDDLAARNLCVPAQEGVLHIKEAVGVDWNAP